VLNRKEQIFTILGDKGGVIKSAGELENTEVELWLFDIN